MKRAIRIVENFAKFEELRMLEETERRICEIYRIIVKSIKLEELGKVEINMRNLEY